jgi:hypothetical protein
MRGEGQGKPIEVVVDQVEIARAGKRVSDVECFPDAAIHRRILGVASGADPVENRRGLRVERREERHVDTSCDQSLCEETRHLLPGPVVAWRGSPGDRTQESNLQDVPGDDTGHFYHCVRRRPQSSCARAIS